MLTFFELLIGVVVIVGVARYIIKGYSATGVLFVGGLLLLIASALMGHKILPSSETSTGYSATDIIEYIKILLMSRGGDPRYDDYDAVRLRSIYDAYWAPTTWWLSWPLSRCVSLTHLIC
ncbi:C4-dicarboxylate transporter DcuC [Kluyvera cryocrescens]|uniref:C4-dicarboxylate transporter DcuC n=1 Tax=Kluyvera cryocrescens TaxID=580 RepID=A0A485CK62_KLUCR|nr:C4-dicarboxylate transporter DcuC [Kluyvera cryocrescens]